MKVLIIPEDQELDRYIVKPIVEALLTDLGRPAQVDVLPEPRLRGSSEALDKGMIDRIVGDNPMVDLFLLIVDRDCDRDKAEARAAARQKDYKKKLIACLARQEVEVWMLALHTDKLTASWAAVRRHCDPKEAYAEPLLDKLGSEGPGRGRKRAMRALTGNWRSLRDRCAELRELQEAISAWWDARKT